MTMGSDDGVGTGVVVGLLMAGLFVLVVLASYMAGKIAMQKEINAYGCEKAMAPYGYEKVQP